MNVVLLADEFLGGYHQSIEAHDDTKRGRDAYGESARGSQEGERNVSLFGSSDGWDGRGVMVTRSSEIKVKERVKGVEGGEGERIRPKGVWEEYEEIGQKG